MMSPKFSDIPQRQQEPQLIIGTQNQMSQSMSKFVAGSFRPEKSELNAPANDYLTKN